MFGFMCDSCCLLMPLLQVPFREAHGLSGKAVFTAETNNIALNQLSGEDLSAVRWLPSSSHRLVVPSAVLLCASSLFFTSNNH